MQNATITPLNLIYKHIEGSKNHARLLFVDFSSAFNTIQPHLLVEKLIEHFNLDCNIVGWILDFLTDRSQRVRVNEHLSTLSRTSTGSPQGCVLSPLLYIMYTNDCCSKFDNHHIVKFADDTVIVSLLNDTETSHGPVLNYFLDWCNEAFLELNVTKTKDVCIDCRRHHPAPVNTTVNGEAVEIVDSYKYLGIIIDDKLTFDNNTNMLIKKSQQRLFCLRKLAKFQVDRSLMTMFNKSFIESVFTFSFICWFASLNLKQRNSLTRITKVSSKIIGTQQQTLSDLYNNQLS